MTEARKYPTASLLNYVPATLAFGTSGLGGLVKDSKAPNGSALSGKSAGFRLEVV